MENAGQFAGTASALMNALTTGMGACASYVEGLLLVRFSDVPAMVMSGQMVILCAGALLIFAMAILRKPAVLARSAAS
jgi:hypothetical protein